MKNKLKILLREAIIWTAIISLAIWMGSQMPKWYSQLKGPFKNGNYSQHVKSHPYALTLYGTSTCPHCESARRFLTEEGIPFNDLVVDKSKFVEDAFNKLGENAVPIFLSEQKLIVGFDKAAYLKLAESEKIK